MKLPEGLGSSDDLSQLSTAASFSTLSTCSGSSSATPSDAKLSRVVQQLQGLKLQLETTDEPPVMDTNKVSAAVERMQQMQVLRQVPRPLVADRVTQDKKGSPPGHVPAHTALPAFAAWPNLNLNSVAPPWSKNMDRFCLGFGFIDYVV